MRRAAAETGLFEAFSLGLGEPIAFSAEHGLGLKPLYDALRSGIAKDFQPVDPMEDADETSQWVEESHSDQVRATANLLPQSLQKNPHYSKNQSSWQSLTAQCRQVKPCQ